MRHLPAETAPASGPEMHAIGFKQGHPIGGENLLDAVYDVDASVRSMNHDIQLIDSVKNIRFTPIGTTDNIECQGAACIKLSFVRARLVRNWLIEHGVPASKLKDPIGQGSPMPQGYKSNDEERFMVRSVRIEIEAAIKGGGGN